MAGMVKGGGKEAVLDALWQAESMREEALPLYVESMVRLYPQQGTRREGHLAALLSVAENADKKDMKAWLERNQAWALATTQMFVNQDAKALAGVDRAYRAFLEGWAGLHPCAEQARKARLEGLEYLVEMEDYLNAYRRGGMGPTTLLRLWNAHGPSMELDPPLVWSQVGMLRGWCLRTLGERVGGGWTDSCTW